MQRNAPAPESQEFLERFERVTREAMLKLHQMRMRHLELQKTHRRLRQEYSELQHLSQLDPADHLRIKMIPLQATLRQAISRIDSLLSQGEARRDD